jgi:serine/threonine protein kinase
MEIFELIAESCARRLEVMASLVGSTAQRPQRICTEVVDTTGFRYPLGKCLGSGGYGKVFLSGDIVLKINCKRQTLGETLILSEKLKHPNVGQVLGIVVLLPYFCQGVCMVLAEGRQLFDLAAQLKSSDALKITIGLAKGVAYLNSRSFVHRDIKPENVLVDANAVAVLLDFGTLCSEGSRVGREGTEGYMAPEIRLTITHVALREIDSWSFAITIVAAMTGFLVRGKEHALDCAMKAEHWMGKFLSEQVAVLLSRNRRPSVKRFLDTLEHGLF